MKTRINELFSIHHPIIQDGMHYFFDLAEMPGAVSNAGGLRIITGDNAGHPRRLNQGGG